MNISIETIVNEGQFVTLDNGELLTVNGYMLESIDQKIHYPINVYFSKIKYVLDRNGQIYG